METHGNLTASSLWQPGELARRMLGERPSPVPPTRDMWPPPQEQLSISTLHLAYQRDAQDEDLFPRRSSTLPSQLYVPTTIPIESETRPRVCTVGTNTDPAPNLLTKVRRIFKRDDGNFVSPTMQLTNLRTKVADSNTENVPRRAFNIKKVISGAKYRVAPNSEPVESPKIVYDIPKPGDRMFTTFGKKERKKCFKFPSKDACAKKIQALRNFCSRRPRSPAHRQPQPLQITQV